VVWFASPRFILFLVFPFDAGKRNESLERSRTKQKAGCAEVRRLMKSARCLSLLVDSPRRCFNYTGALSLVAHLSLTLSLSLSLSPLTTAAPLALVTLVVLPTGHAHRETFRMIRRRRYEISILADKIVEGSRLLCSRVPTRARDKPSSLVSCGMLDAFVKFIGRIYCRAIYGEDHKFFLNS